MLVVSIVTMLIGAMMITAQTVSVWLAGQALNTFALLYNAKDAISFYSNCWNTGSNSHLTFANVRP